METGEAVAQRCMWVTATMADMALMLLAVMLIPATTVPAMLEYIRGSAGAGVGAAGLLAGEAFGAGNLS